MDEDEDEVSYDDMLAASSAEQERSADTVQQLERAFDTSVCIVASYPFLATSIMINRTSFSAVCLCDYLMHEQILRIFVALNR
jgi:hypothetical protein